MGLQQLACISNVTVQLTAALLLSCALKFACNS